MANNERPPLALTPHEAVFERLDDLERISLPAAGRDYAIAAALPRGYARSRRRRFPLLLLVNASSLLGSAVEMSRILAGSSEIRSCIVLSVTTPDCDAAALAALVAACARHYRVDREEIALFVHEPQLLRNCRAGIAGVTRYIVASERPDGSALSAIGAARIAWTVRTPAPASANIHWAVLPEASAAGLAVPALIHGLRSFWSRDHRYGDEALPFAYPVISGTLRRLSPLLRTVAGRKPYPTQTGQRHVVSCRASGRDFEIFVSLPASAAQASGRLYPTLLALDANAGFATVAETVARLRAAGEIEDLVVVGIGTPRAQGEVEFGYRRFEEFSPPPPPDYRFDDALGRFFTSFYALRGQDARQQLGQAPGLWRFLAEELLPRLQQQFPIDPRRLALLGHSAGGTFVGYALAQPDSPFSSYICLSPGVAICGDWMLRQARAALPPAGPTPRLFAAIGAEELENRFNRIAGIPATEAYLAALREQRHIQSEFHALPGESHITVYPRALAQALVALFGTQGATREARRT